MMPGGAHRWEFIGKTPAIFTILVVVLAVNISLGLALAFLGKFIIPQGMANSTQCGAIADYGIRYSVPESVCWFANWNNTISFVLLGVAVLVMLIFRNNVRRVR
jgi:hypothetical protein